jgi:hypothetical protein
MPTNQTQKPKEILKEKLKTKSIYYYVGDGFEVKSREVHKKGIEIHYPFDTRDGSQKYKYISSVVFDGVSPSVVHGVYKNGRGFTRYLSPVIDFLENYPGIGKVVISKKKSSAFKALEVIFNVEDIERLYQRIKPFRDQQTEELRTLTKDLFADVFPRSVQSDPEKYYKGQLTRLIENKKIKAEQLSITDIQVLSELLTQLPAEHPFVKQGKLLMTKEKFEVVSIEATLKTYKKLLKRKNDSKQLEESWHQFFKKNGWILSQMFASPMVIFGDKAYLGGKDLNNKKGKIADFVYRNSFSRSSVIIEIKTHKTPLMAARAYRQPDVFSVSKELGGAIGQVLDQKDTLQKDYHSVTKGTGVESFNPTCIVLAGQLTKLKSDSLKSFELFRNNSKDAIVVTYDELLKRIETILEIFTNKPRKSSS